MYYKYISIEFPRACADGAAFPAIAMSLYVLAKVDDHELISRVEVIFSSSIAERQLYDYSRDHPRS